MPYVGCSFSYWDSNGSCWAENEQQGSSLSCGGSERLLGSRDRRHVLSKAERKAREGREDTQLLARLC